MLGKDYSHLYIVDGMEPCEERRVLFLNTLLVAETVNTGRLLYRFLQSTTTRIQIGDNILAVSLRKKEKCKRMLRYFSAGMFVSVKFISISKFPSGSSVFVMLIFIFNGQSIALSTYTVIVSPSSEIEYS